MLLVTWDTVRVDALRIHGGRAATPTFERIANEGARFEEAISPCPITLPSHATILTGLFPMSHGLHNNAVASLSPSFRTLAEVFQDRDYHTSAVVAALPLESKYGLSRGFDVYDDEWTEPGGLFPFEYSQRRAREVTDAAITHLKEPLASGRPFFQWVHYYDPHFGYLPPEPFATEYRDDPYAGEIAYTDRELSRLIDLLESEGRLDETIIVITSDHGESLGEHGEAYHGSLIYDATQRVPLAVRYPEKIPAGRVLEGQVTLADICPTVIDLAGRRNERVGKGNSLADWLSGGPPNTTPYVFLEAAMLSALFGTTPSRGIRSHETKYIHHQDIPEVYDLGRDPEELDDLGREDKERAERLFETYRKLWQALQESSGQGSGTTLTPEEEEAMRRLGYLGSGNGRPIEWEPKRESDPRPHVSDVSRQLMEEEMLHFLDRERMDLARWQLARLPNDGNGDFLRGKYFDAAGESQKAIEAFDRAWRRGMESSPRFAGGKTWTRGDRLVEVARALKRLGAESATDAYFRAAAQAERPELLVEGAEGLDEEAARPLLELAERYHQPAVRLALSRHWLRSQQPEKSGEILRDAARRWSKDLDILLALAEWEAYHGERGRVDAILERAASLPGSESRVAELRRRLPD
ncbi:MAG: sulfatase-like hydrolase/transferase [Planctomycetota bacterium]